MRLRDQTEDERANVARLRAKLAETLADNPNLPKVSSAPYLTDWTTRRFPDGRVCLHGLCWGHPVLGSVIMTTSALVEAGDGYAVTEHSARLYLLGREDRDQKRRQALTGDRGTFRFEQAAAADIAPEPHGLC